MGWAKHWLAYVFPCDFRARHHYYARFVESITARYGCPKPNVKAELKVLTRTPVVLALLTTVLGAGAMFTLYTYIAPSLTEFTHASPTFITFMLVLIGVGFSIGNHLGGRFADLSINKTLIGFLVLLIVMMVTFPILAQSQIGAAIALVIWGAATFALVPPLQMRVMSVAHEAPGLASSVNIGAFNLGNAVGAAAGALVLDLGWGYSAVSFAGALLAGLGLLLVLFQIKRESSPLKPYNSVRLIKSA